MCDLDPWTELAPAETVATIHAADFARHTRETIDARAYAIDFRNQAIARRADAIAREFECCPIASQKAQTLADDAIVIAQRCARDAMQRANMALVSALCMKDSKVIEAARGLITRCAETTASVAAIGGAQ